MIEVLKVLFLFSLLILLSCTGSKINKPEPNTHRFSSLNDLPISCKDPNKKYQPISTILSKGRYNAKALPYQPVKDTKGYITSDIDNNSITDFIFIERLKEDIRLITCINNRREVSSFKIHETIEADFQTISESISLKKKVLILNVDRNEHNWGSDSEISYYRYQNGNFILSQREITSSSGDGLRSDTYEYYDFQKKRYKRSSHCGNLEEACKSQKVTGTIILAKNLVTLTQIGKGYANLVPN